MDVYRSDRDDPRGALEWVESAFAFGGGVFIVSTPPEELGELIVLSATAEGENTSALITVCLQGECGLGEPEDPEPENPALGILDPFFCRDEDKARPDGAVRPPAPDAAVVLLGLPLVFIAAGRRR